MPSRSLHSLYARSQLSRYRVDTHQAEKKINKRPRAWSEQLMFLQIKKRRLPLSARKADRKSFLKIFPPVTIRRFSEFFFGFLKKPTTQSEVRQLQTMFDWSVSGHVCFLESRALRRMQHTVAIGEIVLRNQFKQQIKCMLAVRPYRFYGVHNNQFHG